MPKLRITQETVGPDRYRVRVELEGDGLPRQTADADIDFKLSDQDQEDLRWYLEDFLQNPHDPAPTIAARVEGRIADIGTGLFKSIFHANDDARDLWATLRDRLNDTRVEVVTSVREAASVPWELLRDPKTDVPLALRAQAFVRAQPQPAQRPQLPEATAGPIRILLVICRPSGRNDVPFRSVASRLIKSLTQREAEAYQLDLLRPPTFAQLAHVLREAKAKGAPYHVVHFDGHGDYVDTPDPQTAAEALKWQIPLLLGTPRTGRHGYLLFEDPEAKENVQWVDGPELGKLLAETDVPVLVLNACRSAYAEAREEPAQAGPQAAKEDVHGQIRAYGTLAQEAMDAGVAGVVAMRYSVYVVTAAQFVADLYASLVQGRPLGEAVTMGRKQLAAQPNRTIAYEPRPLQDWSVPVVYEAASIPLFPEKSKEVKLAIRVEAGEATAARGSLDPNLPKEPDAGFFGRDETLLALDRAFDTQRIVLLHAFAGSGKTATAAEFARWYSITGGIRGPVLFISFGEHKPLIRVLDQIERVFDDWLKREHDIDWLTLDDAKRRKCAIEALKRVSVLWVWDNVEPVAGFPKGTPSAWTPAEQTELADFLRDARGTMAKFLLTSRRDEQDWLGDLPARVLVPPMPMQERVQLAKAIAEKRGHRLTDVEDWRPLLRFTEGNPLTITVLVGQALRDGLTTRAQIEAFVEKLRAGEAEIQDDESQGRSASLGASLKYGFEHAFTEPERKQLALLHFFQGFVNVGVLCRMGELKTLEGEDYSLDDVRGLTRDEGIALLDRAVEIGLLTPHGGGCYSIHPALPWFLQSLFHECYEPPSHLGPRPRSTEHRTPQLSAIRAFVEAMGILGDTCHRLYEVGSGDAITTLSVEESNLLHARRLGRRHGLWRGVTCAMQGLDQLYEHTGRHNEWERLVQELVPDLSDPATEEPLPGLETDWCLVNEYRVRLAMDSEDWAKAERLQRIRVALDRRRAIPTLAKDPDTLDDRERGIMHSLAVALEHLADIQRGQENPDCLRSYEEVMGLAQRVNDKPEEAAISLQMAIAYRDLAAVRDLVKAEAWCRHSLELRHEGDAVGRGRCLVHLGNTAWIRFGEALRADEAKEKRENHVSLAMASYQQALELLPAGAIEDLAACHNGLGNMYGFAHQVEKALDHLRTAIQLMEAAGNRLTAGMTRYNVALALARVGRFADARDYAHAGLTDLLSVGQRGSEYKEATQQLLADIEKAMSAQQTGIA